MTSKLLKLCRAVNGLRVQVSAVALLLVLAVVAVAAGEDPVLKWNEVAARTASLPNPVHIRIMGITQLAVFEAVNAITREYEPYLEPALVAPPGASLDAAVVTAAHRALTNYLPSAALDALRDVDLAAIPNGPDKTAGIVVGLAAANAIIALRTADGSLPLTTVIPPTPAPAGTYQLTTGCAAAQFTNWPAVTPFGIPDVSPYLLVAPPALTSNQYRKDYEEVVTMGGANSIERPLDRAEVARLYAAASPTFVVSMATRQIAVANSLSSSESAHALALTMMAVNDSLIASMYNKYEYNRARPETLIRNGANDGNDETDGDDSFATFIATPCHPSYPSNHASATGGGLEAMRRLFGAAGHYITITISVPALGSLPATVITKQYTQLQAIADDVDDARVYGGIHWRADQVAGGALGRTIAAEVVKNNLLPQHP